MIGSLLELLRTHRFNWIVQLEVIQQGATEGVFDFDLRDPEAFHASHLLAYRMNGNASDANLSGINIEILADNTTLVHQGPNGRNCDVLVFNRIPDGTRVIHVNMTGVEADGNYFLWLYIAIPRERPDCIEIENL